MHEHCLTVHGEPTSQGKSEILLNSQNEPETNIVEKSMISLGLN